MKSKTSAILFFSGLTPDDDNKAFVTVIEVVGDNNNYKIEVDDWIDTNEMIKPAVIESGQGMVNLFPNESVSYLVPRVNYELL